VLAAVAVVLLYGGIVWGFLPVNPRISWQGHLAGAAAGQMVAFAAPPAEAVIAEYGPGTGAFTRHILGSLTARQRFFAVEINPDFAAALERRFPELHLRRGNAADIETFCRREGVDHVDCVISGLPWAIFPEAVQTSILDATLRVLPPGGTFVSFAYLQGLVMPAGRRFKRTLRQNFSRIQTSGIVWRNVPPAIVYRCIK
ncbi:MAG: methyltransferase domain-containing protein, partial [Planctomycetes bacterium]|nr:methyltransferase domain-containing protein [Planctomycetota bacterium]